MDSVTGNLLSNLIAAHDADTFIDIRWKSFFEKWESKKRGPSALTIIEFAKKGHYDEIIECVSKKSYFLEHPKLTSFAIISVVFNAIAEYHGLSESWKLCGLQQCSMGWWEKPERDLEISQRIVMHLYRAQKAATMIQRAYRKHLHVV